jgi:hypothetical protein
MAGLLVTIIGIAIQQGVQEANRVADINERRKTFTTTTVRNMNDKGYNAVIVSSGYKAKGFAIKETHPFEGMDYTLFAAPRNQVMIVENRGDGGYENWALQGTYWVRWGKIVKFHPSWNEHMGTPYETRHENDFVGWEY